MKMQMLCVCLFVLASARACAAEIVIPVVSQGWQISFEGPTLMKESPSYEAGGFQCMRELQICSV